MSPRPKWCRINLIIFLEQSRMISDSFSSRNCDCLPERLCVLYTVILWSVELKIIHFWWFLVGSSRQNSAKLQPQSSNQNLHRLHFQNLEYAFISDLFWAFLITFEVLRVPQDHKTRENVIKSKILWEIASKSSFGITVGSGCNSHQTRVTTVSSVYGLPIQSDRGFQALQNNWFALVDALEVLFQRNAKVGTWNLRFRRPKAQNDLATPPRLHRSRCGISRAQRNPISTPKSIDTVAGFESPRMEVETWKSAREVLLFAKLFTWTSASTLINNWGNRDLE